VAHTNLAQIAALVGALGAVLALVPRGRFFVMVGLGLLGAATVALAISLVGTDDLELLVEEPAALVALLAGIALICVGAVPLVRYPAVTPVVLLAVAPFRVPVELGDEEAFLLLPLYVVLASAVIALAVRMLRDEHPPAVPFQLALPIGAFVVFASISLLWTWDERAGGIALAFFLFPFVAGLGVVARSPLAAWLPRALVITLASLGTVFAAVGIWQAHSRTLFFSRDVEVANAYTTFFRVTSLFKDPSLYGRYLVIPMVVLLVVLLARKTRSVLWIGLAGVVAFLFLGLFFSYSQSSFVALFVTVAAIAFVAGDRRFRVVLVACAVAATLAAGAFAAAEIEGRSARDVTSGRSRLVDITYEAFKLRPVVGVGIGGQPAASAEAIGRRSPKRNASHTTPLTVLAELGLVGFGLYLWMLAAVGVALVRISRVERTFALGLAAVLSVLFVHSLLYAGFFEDPVTWGAIGLVAALLVRVRAEGDEPAPAAEGSPSAPGVLAH
jgi:hypothetical protein